MPSVKEYSYEWLLDRVYSKIPRHETKYEVFRIPKVQVIIIGGKTHIKNFRQIADAMNRDPRLLARYFAKELAVPAIIDDTGSLVLHGKFSPPVLNKLLEHFAKNYVICPTCGSHHTILVKEGKVFKLKCLACGAETTLKAF